MPPPIPISPNCESRPRSSTGNRGVSEAPAPLCVTIGEPAGIGPDIILSAWANRKREKLPPFYVLGDPAVLSRRALELNLPIATASVEPGDSRPPLSGALAVVPLSGAMRAGAGKPDPADGPLVVEAIRNGVAHVLSGRASALVTCPISKEALYATGFGFPGHTEFLAELARQHDGANCLPVMMIASDMLRTIPVTIHIPLREVADALTSDLIHRTCIVAHRDLQRRFGMERPRLAVAGLNPHAGEGGALGREEIEIIAPAVKRLRDDGIDVVGPLPADTMFHAAARARYDVAVCMYHDQALIPAKALAFDDGVNVTLGLPFVRTSPDHGTAFSIAGSGAADPSSFIAALRMAWRMAPRAGGK